MMWRFVFAFLAISGSCAWSAEAEPNKPASFEAGFARVDITPEKSLRLSGYASRTTSFERVEAPIFTRAMAFRANDGDTFVLLAVDTIGPPGKLTDEVSARVEKELGISRRHIVFCGSHSHATPHLPSGLTNLFSVPLTDVEKERADAYSERFSQALFDVAKQAVADLAPAKFSFGQGKVGFAMNRRGNRPPDSSPPPVPPRGAVDHSVPVLKITGDDGKLRGVVFNYACHATTIGQNFIDGDWPGYASRDLEDAHEGIVALCTIGCGGDANPAPRGGDHPEMHARAHGRELAMEVERVIKEELSPLTAAPTASYGFAGLPIDRPTVADLEAQLKSGSVQEKLRAQYYLDLLKRMDRLPESFPMPIEGWKFGDQLTMVFLGGEVVVDYALRLKKEIDTDLVWVSAYCNDVFGYVASERVRSEGGYEVDSSMIYYNQLGRWSTGTEEIVIRRVHELLANPGGEEALSPEEAKQTLAVPKGMSVALAASEPLVEDPVNFAFGPDGRLWVVEMRDYPRGEDGLGKPGGRVKVLSDTDGDGTFDKADLFLDGLAYPNGVMPWRDGAFVSCAPDVFFAKDTDGDGKADSRDVFLTGFPEANPQHRVNGFTWGLDGYLYLTHAASGISSPKTGKEYNFAGRDFALHPDTGEVRTMSGDSQFGRTRDIGGTWFGNSNSHPLYHYVTEDFWLARNPHVSLPSPRRVIVAPEAYQVWPDARIIDRFNDLRSESRFTSACGPHTIAAPGFDDHTLALVCEPVHNLVRAFRLLPDGLTYTTEILPVERAAQPAAENAPAKDTSKEFFSSTDPWFRPVRVVTGPDGAIWVADMYRLVIEHPQWIPEAWQARLNLRAGSDLGRIWRISKADHPASPLPNLTKESTADLVARLGDPNGALRDLAQQLLIWQADAATPELIQKFIATNPSPASLIQAISTLGTLDAFDVPTLTKAIGHADPRVAQFAIVMAAPLLNEHPELGQAIIAAAAQEDERVRMHAALALGEWNAPEAAAALAKLAAAPDRTGWIRVAVQSSARPHADALLAELLKQNQTDLAAPLVATILGEQPVAGPKRILDLMSGHSGEVATWQIDAIAAIARKVTKENHEAISTHPVVREILAAAQQRLNNGEVPIPDRIAAAKLMASAVAGPQDHQTLLESLTPQFPIEIQEEIIVALGVTGSPETAAKLFENWSQYPPRVRRVVLQATLSRPQWTAVLLDELAEKTVQPSDLDAAAREQLASSTDSDIRARAQQLLQQGMPSSRESIVADFQAVATMPADLARGRAIFEKSCATCHKLDGLGKDFGPNLATLTDRSPSTLLIALLDPNRAVEAKFRGYVVVTKNGQVLNGLITTESTNAITLAGADGRTTELLRSDIEELRDSGKSFMPEGLERDLSKQDLADVLLFVRETNN